MNLKTVIFLGILTYGDCRTVYNQLIPDSLCKESGEYGCICDKSVDCNRDKYLECIDGQCVCEFPHRRTFDHNLGKCVSKVGSYCGDWIPECGRNAECDNGRCSCKLGYSRTVNNTCMINFGEECGPRMCNPDRGLACKEGRCQCLDSSFVYSALSTNCIDPEAVVSTLLQQFMQRLFSAIVNFKVRKVVNVATLPLRVIKRLAFGGLG